MPDITRVSACLLGLSLGLPGAATASIIESAIDTSGLTGFVDLAYGDHTINSSVAVGVEVDNYRFQGNTGDRVRLIVSSSTLGFDPQIVLRDASGAVVQTASCNGNPFGPAQCTTNLDQTLSSTGTYFLNLSDIGSNESGNYTLSLYQYPPVNNWDGIAYDAPLSEQLGHLGDMDFLAFSGSAGTGVKISLASNTLGLDPLLEVWDPLGNLVESTSCNGNPFGPTICSVAPELNLTETGIYRIGLSDVGWNETGNYSIGVSCLFGDCPSAAPSPVPVPAAIWLFGSGLAGLLVTTRRNRT